MPLRFCVCRAVLEEKLLIVKTTHFGDVEVTDEQIFTATVPVPGFPDSKRFFFIERDKIKPFKWLQSADDGALTFVVVEPGTFFHDFEPKIGAFDIKEIGLSRQDEALMMVIVVLPDDLSKMTANLRGPLIINVRDRLFKQVFIETDRWTVRESILEGIKRRELAALEAQKKAQHQTGK